MRRTLYMSKANRDAAWKRQGASGKDPTAADWAELKVLADQTPETQILKVAEQLGIAHDDPRVVELLNLAK